MAVKARTKRRPIENRGRSTFNRRLTWREIRSHFEQLTQIDLDSTEAKRIILRFRRARGQIMPVFGWMLVSPYEAERKLAVALLARIGGQQTLEIVQRIIADQDVYDAFKPALRALCETLEAGLAQQADTDDETDDEAAELSEDEEGASPGRKAGRTRAPRGRGRSRVDDEDESQTESSVRTGRRRGRSGSVRDVERLFAKPGPAFIEALDGPMDDLISAFWQLEAGKRVAFADGLAKIDDPRLAPFLSTLLASTDRALVLSALNAIGKAHQMGALDGVKALLNRDPHSSIKSKAETVLAMLTGQPLPQEPPVAEVAEVAGSGASRPRPQPKRAGAPAVDTDALGLGLWPSAAAPETGEPLVADQRLPRLRNCLATGVGLDGAQRIRVYRNAVGGGVSCLELWLTAQGWQTSVLISGLPTTADREDLATATDEGRGLVEVTMAYGRSRAQSAQKDGERAVAPAELAWLGSGKREAVVEELPAEPPTLAAEVDVKALLEHPLMADWRVHLSPTSRPASQWYESRGRRDASRVRKTVIDEVATGIAALLSPAELVWRLQAQAVLLRRAGAVELADLALAEAMRLSAGRHRDSQLLREIAYRAMGQALTERRALRAAERDLAVETPARPQPEPKAAPPVEVFVEPEVVDDEPVPETEPEKPRRPSRRRRGGRGRRSGVGRAAPKKPLRRQLMAWRRQRAARSRAATAARVRGTSRTGRRR